VITWTADKYREISAGFNTPAWGDDEFNIWGTRTGTRVNGKSYTAVVDAVKPLHKTTACRFVVSGVATITPAGGSVRTLDFGDGSCDNKATLTVNGQSRQITLRH
jgi:hypothetical protein